MSGSKSSESGPRAPSSRSQSVRASLLEALRAAGELGGASSARELSAAVGISERDVPAHLAHLARSLKAQGLSLVVEPAACKSCGYAFADRARFEPPGSCPSCRGTRVAPPRFSVR
ncbi:MAG: transcriptional regulator [Polyangiales bacterium]